MEWRRGKRTLIPMLKKADIVLTEREDAEILFGKKEPDEIAEEVLSMRAEVVAVKLGAEGAAAYTRKEKARKPAYKVPIVDVIGAGDAFAAGFIACLMKGRSLQETLEVGNAAGALVVTVRGDYENMPSWEDIEKFLAAQRKETVILR